MTAEAFDGEDVVPDLAPGATPAAIRSALVEEERADFDRDYQQALREASETLDLTRLLGVLRSYHRIAVQTRQHGVATHRRMLEKARLIASTGRNPDGVPLDRHRITIDRRLGRQVYRVVVDEVVEDAVRHLPASLLLPYAEVLATLEVAPSTGRPYMDSSPERPMRQIVFGPAGRGLVTYLTLENEREVHVLVLYWIE